MSDKKYTMSEIDDAVIDYHQGKRDIDIENDFEWPTKYNTEMYEVRLSVERLADKMNAVQAYLFDEKIAAVDFEERQAPGYFTRASHKLGGYSHILRRIGDNDKDTLDSIVYYKEYLRHFVIHAEHQRSRFTPGETDENYAALYLNFNADYCRAISTMSQMAEDDNTVSVDDFLVPLMKRWVRAHFTKSEWQAISKHQKAHKFRKESDCSAQILIRPHTRGLLDKYMKENDYKDRDQAIFFLLSDSETLSNLTRRKS